MYFQSFEVKFTWPGNQLDTGTVEDYKVSKIYEDGSNLRCKKYIEYFSFANNMKNTCQVFYTTNSSLLQQPGNLVAGGQLFNLTNEQVEQIIDSPINTFIHNIESFQA